MIAAIYSEFRKLLSVRSTYFIVLVSMIITAVFGGIIFGYNIDKAGLADPHLLEGASNNGVVFVGFILAFAGLLLAGHEYRYSTIMYTLTSTNRRWKILVAKFIAITVFAVITSILIAFWSPLCTIIGTHLKGIQYVPQDFSLASVIWHCVFVGWGYAMYAFILLLILRNQVGAIVTFLMVPLIGENILTLLLKENAKYLPFTSLQQVIGGPGGESAIKVSDTASARTALIYIIIGLIVSTILFIRRDAN